MTEEKTAEFEAMLDQYRGLIYKIALNYCASKDDLNDLLQEIAIQLWRSFHKYNPEFKFSTWIYRIALNTSISFLRKTSSREKYIVQSDSVLIEEFADEESKHEQILIRSILRKLEKYPRALLLLHLEGLDYQEISEILNISPSNVSTKISRIKKQLARLVQEDSE